jgi:kynurenine formamidase
MTEYRATFDAHVTFLNGGGLQVQGFKLDIPGDAIAEAQLAELFVKHLGLLMVERVRFGSLKIDAEPHKGSRGGPSATPAAPEGTTRLIELNHVIEAGTVTYPGLPAPQITPHLSRADSRKHYEQGTEFAIDRISMVGNTGTYLDSPYHRYADGIDLADLPLSAVADLPIVVARMTDSAERGIGPPALASLDIADAAVLLHTGWDRYWGTPEYDGQAPFLTAEGAQFLVNSGARLVGIDGINIDDTTGTSRPAHSTLLAAGIPVLEHLTGLAQLPAAGARLHAAPVRIRSFGTFPVRAYATVAQ